MALFKMAAETAGTTTTLTIGFGAPASNADIVKHVEQNAPALAGKLLLVSGPASLLVAFFEANLLPHQRRGSLGARTQVGGFSQHVLRFPQLLNFPLDALSIGLGRS